MSASAASRPAPEEIVRRLLRQHPKSHAERLGIAVARDTPSPLFQWLVASLLYSARISGDLAEAAAKALSAAGWRTAEAMAAATWRQRVTVLNRAGYARYDESTARYLGETAELLQSEYGGDLRRLRRAADGDPAALRRRLKAFKGIGEVGADIFCREVQVPWPEIHPFADGKARRCARSLGLPDEPAALARLVRRRADLPRLLSALVQVRGAKERETLLRAG